MTFKNTVFALTILLFTVSYTYSQDYHVRFGFLGNSITIGTGLANAKTECYPSQIGKLLEENYGDTCIIGNFAVSGTTMLKLGDYPLWETAFFQKGWSFAPDICFIMLGTNDSKPQNWDVYKNEYLDDYLSMIDTFKLRNANTKFIVCYPPPAYAVVWGIRNEVILNEIIPYVDSVLSKREAVLVDFYTPLIDSVYLFPDKIHPNAAGAKVMAKIAYNRIVESGILNKVVKGGTFVTSIETEKDEIKKGDTAIISWNAINALEVFLNGVAIPNTGSIKLAPPATTVYKLLATGELSKDSLSIEQKVYNPQLTLISIEPNRVTITEGESIDLNLYFYDQRSNIMNDTLFSIDWSIVEGDGNIVNNTDSSATYTAGSVGKTKVKAANGEVSYTTTITVESATGIGTLKEGEISVFPNPCGDLLNISISNSINNRAIVSIFDLLGSLQFKENIKISDGANHIAHLDVKNLKTGIYIYSVEFSGNHLRGKLIKE